MTTEQRVHLFTAPEPRYRAVVYFPVCELVYGIAERKCQLEEESAELLEYFTRKERQ